MKIEKLIFKNSKKQKLVGILYKPEKKQFPIAIFCHGYRSDKNNSKVRALKETLTEKGIGLFAFDFTGRGESDGKFEDTTITQYIDDLKCCIGMISKKTEKIAVIGSSLGGLVMLNESVKDKRVKLLILLSPVSRFPWKKTGDFAEINAWKKRGYSITHSDRFGDMKIKYSFYEDGLKYKSPSKYKKIKIPTIIIHGTVDQSVSFEDSKKLNKLIKESKLITIKGADHRYQKEKDFNKVVNETTKFISQKFK